MDQHNLFASKLAFPVGYPAPIGSFGLFFDRSPKATCSTCKFIAEFGNKEFACDKAKVKGEYIGPIKRSSAACKFYQKRKSRGGKKKEAQGDTHNSGVKEDEKPAFGTSEPSLDLFKQN